MRAYTQLTKRRVESVLGVVLVLTLVVATSAFAQQTAEQLLQSGLYQEDVKGDLDEAIKAYERILNEFPKNRPVAAQALLHIGLCYEKLGETEARKHYQQLIQEYGDQPALVAQARVRLSKLGFGTNGETLAMSTRQVWAPSLDDMGRPSPDGRYFSYVNWDKGNLALHDIETGENRDLTDEGTWYGAQKFSDVSIWSPDSSQIAYCWLDGDTGTDLRIVGLDGSEPRVLYSDPESGYLLPRAWSHDGKHILGTFCNKGSAAEKESGHIDKMGLVSVEEGSLRILKTMGKRRSLFMDISPDGRYVVFDRETEEDSIIMDIHLLSVDGSRETPLVVHPANDGAPFWSPDGKRIVFTSDRSGSNGLWTLEVDEGKPKGAPTLVKEMGSKFGPMGFTPDGSFYYSVGNSTTNVYVATLDFEGGKVLAPPTKMSLRFEGSNLAPFWSPDGKYLAYASRRSVLETYLLVIRSVDTGEERDLSPKSLRMHLAQGYGAPRWSPDGRSILVAGGAKGVLGLFLVDVQTGDFTTIMQDELRAEGPDSKPRWPVFSKDGKQIYYVRGRSMIMAHDLETRRERELYRSNSRIERLACSPDGRRLAFFEVSQAVQPNVVKTISTSGGEPSELYTPKTGNKLSRCGLSWTPDGAHVVVGEPGGPDKPEALWMIPAEGGEPRKLEVGVKDRHAHNLSLHPDGQRIAFTYSEPGGGSEVWALENFLPESKAGM